MLGYGSPNNATARQTLEVLVIDGSQETVTSRIGHERLAGGAQRPSTSDESKLARSEKTLIDEGYVLHSMPDNGRTRATIPGDPVVVTSSVTTPRPVQVVYRVTLDPRTNGATVNDDLILNPPTVASC